MTTAAPKFGTRMSTAVCRHCGETIYKPPYGPWMHLSVPGPTICNPPEETP